LHQFQNVLFQLDGNKWNKIPGTNNHEAVSHNGNLYVIKTVNTRKRIVQHWNGKNWKSFDGPNTKALDVDRSIVAIRDHNAFDDVVTVWNGKKWQPIPGTNNKDVKVIGNTVFSLKNDGFIYTYNL